MKLAGKVAINVSALTAGRLLNSLTGVVAVAIAARYLEVESYGALITAIAFTGLIGSITNLGSGNIGAREISKRPHERELLLRVVFSVNIALAAAALLVGLLLMFLLYGGEGQSLEREAILLLLAPTLVLPAASTVGVFFLAEQKNYLGMIASVAGSLALLLVVFLTEELDWGFTGIAAAYAANTAVFSLGMIALGLKFRLHLWPSRHRDYFMQIIKWTLPLGGSVVITALYWRLDVLLVGLIAGDAEVGIYGLAFKVVDVLVTLPLFVMLVLLPEFSRLSENRDRFSEIIQKAFSVMQTAAGPLLVGMVIFAEPVITLVGGDQFQEAVPILRLLMVGVALSFLSSVCAQGMIAVNQQGTLFRLSIYGLIVNAALNAAFIPLWGGTGAAVAYAITEFVAFGMLITSLRKHATLHMPEHLAGFVLALLAMASVGLIQLIPFVADLPSIVVLLVGGPLSVAVYVAALYAFRAVPPVIHDSLVMPLWRKARGGGAAPA